MRATFVAHWKSGQQRQEVKVSTGIVITREDRPEGGRYVGKIDGIDGEAELVFGRRDAQTILARHTEVPAGFRGRGIGRALVQRLVGDARAEGAKIVAVCPYVRSERDKHPEWADVFRG